MITSSNFLKSLRDNLSNGKSDNLPIIPVVVTPVDSYQKLLKFVMTSFGKQCLLVIFTGLVIGFFNAATAALAGSIYSTINQVSQPALLLQLVATTIFLSAVALFSYSNALWVKLLNTNTITLVFPRLFSHILNLPLTVTKHYSSGDLTQRLADYEASITQILSFSVEILLSVFALIFLLGYMAYCDWRIAVCYLVAGFIFMMIKLILFRINIKYIRAQLQGRGKLAGFLSEIFLQIHKIRSANAEQKIFRKWLSLLVDLKIDIEKSVTLEVILAMLETLAPLFLLLSCYYFVYFNNHNNLVLMLQFIICATQFIDLFSRLSMQLLAIIHYIPNLQRISPLLIDEPPKNINLFVNQNLQGEIVFAGVSYRVSPTEPWILKDVNLKIAPGQFIGILGASGSGKSTLFKLLLGFEPVTAGIITLDNENISHVDWRSMRKQFGVVLQSSNIFPGTILANLSIHQQLTMEEAWELAEAVGLTKDIHNMPMKMFTYISDNAGEAISGGQKQKILMARALASKPRIMLLDEATSALDEASQTRIFQHLEKLTITRFVIAHRLTTLAGADKIYVMDGGRIKLCKPITSCPAQSNLQ